MNTIKVLPVVLVESSPPPNSKHLLSLSGPAWTLLLYQLSTRALHVSEVPLLLTSVVSEDGQGTNRRLLRAVPSFLHNFRMVVVVVLHFGRSGLIYRSWLAH